MKKVVHFSEPHELAPERYGIGAGTQVVDVAGLFYGGDGSQSMSVSDLISHLEKEYCDTIAAEFQHLRVTIFLYISLSVG